MLDDLRLDIIQFAVNLQCLLAAAFGTIAHHVLHIKRDRLLTTELALSAVNRNPAHHRHHTVLPRIAFITGRILALASVS